MPLSQSQLRPKTYTELVEEGRKLIPGLAPTWTNHNPSDPGIALIELFAWLTEMILYRVERVPLANYEQFLRLLDPTYKPEPFEDDATRKARILAEIRTAVQGLRRRYRAITPEDYTQLILEEWPETSLADLLPLIFEIDRETDSYWMELNEERMELKWRIKDLPADLPEKNLNREKLAIKLQRYHLKRYLQHNYDLDTQKVLTAVAVDAKRIKRVECVPEYDLENDQTHPKDGHVSLIVILDGLESVDSSDFTQRFAPSDALRGVLWAYLDERRLVATRHHVVGPSFQEVSITATLYLHDDALWSDVEAKARNQLDIFFHPLDGGPQGSGWPLGRAVYPSEVYQVLEGIPGVDYVMLTSPDGPIVIDQHQLVKLKTSTLTPGSDNRNRQTPGEGESNNP